MRSILILLICSIITIGCNQTKIDFNELTSAIVKAEKIMNGKELIISAVTSNDKETIKFSFLVKDRLINEQAKGLVIEFFNEIEKGIQDKELLRNNYIIKFEIKSQKNGEVLFKGQRNKGEETIWWQL